MQLMLIFGKLNNGSRMNVVLASGLMAAINEAHQLYSACEIWYTYLLLLTVKFAADLGSVLRWRRPTTRCF